MFDLFRVRQARREAHAVLAPFVLRTSRDRPAPEAGDWLQPQILGFLATLVTLIAERRCGALRTHRMASVQSDVLNAVTGIGPELIGEEICLLSSRRDPAFTAGSAGAAAFLDAMTVMPAYAGFQAAEMAGGGCVLDRQPDSARLNELWDEHVASRMTWGQALG